MPAGLIPTEEVWFAVGRFDGTTALITGGTSGIGLATARRLVDEGARVLVTGRSADGVETARSALGRHALVVQSDTSSVEALHALAEQAGHELGALDLLFLNAGITRHCRVDRIDEQTFDTVFAVNARGAYFGAQQLGPLVRRGGSIVFNSSVVATKGVAAMSAYAASKAAVRSLTRSLARETLERGVRVNAVTPGPIATGFGEKNLGAEAGPAAQDRLVAQVPMGRVGRPDEVVAAVLFLAFDATFTTGSEVTVDGGGSQL